jgi:hypothetical protein
MTLPIGAAVCRRDTPDLLGRIVRSPHGNRAPRGMAWVQWEDRAEPVRWHRMNLVYVARRYGTALAWRGSQPHTLPGGWAEEP